MVISTADRRRRWGPYTRAAWFAELYVSPTGRLSDRDTAPFIINRGFAPSTAALVCRACNATVSVVPQSPTLDTLDDAWERGLHWCRHLNHAVELNLVLLGIVPRESAPQLSRDSKMALIEDWIRREG